MTGRIEILGTPVDSGKRRQGCRMGPDALRCAGLPRVLSELGHDVQDLGTLAHDPVSLPEAERLFALPQTVAWTAAIARTARAMLERGTALFLGGDHALSLGTLHGAASHAARAGRPLYVLWLDAHADFNTPVTSPSGNLHGTPLAYAVGRGGFDAFPPMEHPIPEANVTILGLRSVDAQERTDLEASRLQRADMRAIDEHGLRAQLAPVLDRVARAGGHLHVSLDVDFLDPAVAPAVGTTVPGGATVREAHLAMEMIHDSGLMTSMDLVELNPMLDEGGRTVQLMVDLCASAFGRRVFDRPTPRRL